VCWQYGSTGHLCRDCRLGLRKGDQDSGKRVNAGEERGPLASPPSTPQFTLNILGEGTSDSLIAEGWIQGKPSRVTIDLAPQ